MHERWSAGVLMAQKMQTSLEEHRANGHLGPLQHITVHATESVSYAAPDVEQYARRHLSNVGRNRKWRVSNLDAADSHESVRRKLRRIARDRGYVGPVPTPLGITGDLQG